MPVLVVSRPARPTAHALAAWSRAWLADDEAPSLLVAVPAEESVVLGAFQRASELPPGLVAATLERRGSGGGAVRVGPGSVWVQLRLPRADALVPATPDKLLNRLVRPLLGALTRAAGVPARYFGRDWVSMANAPVGLVAFGHEASSGRCLFEAIVGVRTAFAASVRPSLLGKPAATLEALSRSRRPIEPDDVAAAIVEGYGRAAGEVRERDFAPALADDAPGTPLDPPWIAVREEAIGVVGAGPDGSGKLRLGGELMASRDGVARLEELASGLPPDASADDVGRVVDDTLASGGVVLFGVRSLGSIRDVLVEARQNMACRTLEK